VVFIYLSVVTIVYLFQRRLQYFPDPSPPGTPSSRLYPGLEEVGLETSDGVKLQAWYLAGKRPLTVVVFHGNGGHRGHRVDLLERFQRMGLGLFLLDYRGYGGSEGSPHEAGLYADAEAAISWCEARVGPELIYFGESLGSGVAVEMATRKTPRALIIESGFSSAVDVAQKHYPFLPVGILMRDRYAAAEKIGRVACPLLMLHGDSDQLVPMEFGKRLYDVANEPRQWHVMAGAGHNDLRFVDHAAYDRILAAFVATHLGDSEKPKD
jgi:fermentation-respiration switch protein FrsA (DUF1100 family)